MLYHIIKPLVRLAAKLYFRNFQVRGKLNIPASGPCILVANHPATFMDGLLIAAHTKRKVYFLSKSTMFKTRFVAWLLSRLNMIPVYRKQDDPEQLSKNMDTFEKCFRHLDQNGVLLIFPEGISTSGRKLHEIKTGAARIALGALERGNIDIKIVCIGMNYEQNATFQTNAVMQVAAPIDVKQFASELVAPQNAVKKLTEKIAEMLAAMTVSIDEPETDVFVSRIEEMYRPVLMETFDFDKKDKSNDFFLTRKIVAYTATVKRSDPWKLCAIKKQVDEYFWLLQQWRISDAALRRIQNRKYFLCKFMAGFFYLLAGFPLFVYGFLTNIFPYVLTARLSRKMSVYTEFRVAISFSAGIFVYLAFYALLMAAASCVSGSFWFSALLLCSFPLAGLYAYLYANYFKQLNKKWRVFRLMFGHTCEMSGLFNRRKAIIAELDRVRMQADYVF